MKYTITGRDNTSPGHVSVMQRPKQLGLKKFSGERVERYLETNPQGIQQLIRAANELQLKYLIYRERLHIRGKGIEKY